MPKRLGRQNPTLAVVLPYKKSRGSAAVNLYKRAGFDVLPWEELVVFDMMAIDDENGWIHSRFGYSVPRQNGKNECVCIREMYGIVELEERILHTAQLASTSHKAWERLTRRLDNARIEYDSIRAKGSEKIEVKGGGVIEFRTRTSLGGMGESFDLLVIDEAQEYTEDQKSALQYTIAAAANPQTILLGTPPTPYSKGTIFPQYRADTLSGQKERAGWEEWGIGEKPQGKEDIEICRDRDLWIETNPSLGYFVKESTIADEIGGDLNDFIIQRLGYWHKYSQTSAISKKAWMSLVHSSLPQFEGKLYVAVKYSQKSEEGGSVSMAIAVKTNRNTVWVEAIDCRSRRDGDAWLLEFLQQADWRACAIDGASGQGILAEEMKNNKLAKPLLPKVQEIIDANAMFEQGIYGGTIEHSGQRSLVQVIGNCEHRNIGNKGGYGYKAQIQELDITLLEAVSLAYWLAMTTKEKKKQSFGY